MHPLFPSRKTREDKLRDLLNFLEERLQHLTRTLSETNPLGAMAELILLMEFTERGPLVQLLILYRDRRRHKDEAILRKLDELNGLWNKVLPANRSNRLQDQQFGVEDLADLDITARTHQEMTSLVESFLRQIRSLRAALS